VDLGRPEEIQEVMTALQQYSARLDVLVNNAGIEVEKPFAEVTLAEWEQVMGVNLRGAFLLTQAALPLFSPKGGAVINISSIHATRAFPGSTVYACSKAALVALTRNLALELAPRRIRVNSISPGYVDTRLWEEYLRHAPDPASVERQTTALHPLGRRGVPADIAEAALFFAADTAAFVTGSDLVIDGGLTVRGHGPIG
jgi:NAD(P)-dependent dehydrogenase (short-subunit alcohol dehydrogenase family)